MRGKTCIQKGLTWFLIVLLAWPASLAAQEGQQDTQDTQDTSDARATQPYIYTQQQLDELLAPIALYPDALLSQILMASTYPLEVVQANRWLKQNPGLTGDRLDEALKEESWDVSVKSLCHFPQVLAMMDEKLDVTTDLGNAFLSQEDQVMDTIQRLRDQAQAQGNLKSTEQQKVIIQDRNIIIEPAYPDVVYVPAYNPCWVYGPWWYPACSPPWFWYPGIVVGAGFYWGPRIFVGPLGFWCGFFWPHRRIFVNVNKTVFINRVGPSRMHGGVETWRHNPVHRRGIAYPDSATAQRFGRAPAPDSAARRPFRGFESGPEMGPRAPRPPERGPRGPMGPRRPGGPGGPGGPERREGPEQARPDGRSQPRPEARPGAGPEVRPETIPRPRPETMPQAIPQAIPEMRPEPEQRGFDRQRVQPRGVPSGERGFGRPEGGPARPAPDQPPGGRAFQGFGRGGIESQQQSERGRQSMGVPPGRGSPPSGTSQGGEGFGRPEGGGGPRPGGGGGGPRGGGSGGGRAGGGGRPGR